MNFYADIFLPYLVPAIGTALSGLLAWAITALIGFINSKVKNKELASLLETIVIISTNAVKATYQSFVESVKGTTEWNEETKEKARQMTLNTIKSELSVKAIAYIQEKHGDIDKYLLNLAESILYDLKNKPTTSV
jgi:hypothetical protein